MGSTNTPKRRRKPKIAVKSVKIEQERLDQLAVIAAANRRTVVAEIRWLIDRHIEAGESGGS